MTENNTKIREVFIDISPSQPVLNYHEKARASKLTAMHTAYCVIAFNSVFSNIVSSD